MHFDLKMDLNDVRLFVIVARTGKFSVAGKESGLPTSTVSRSITRLERNIGTLLCIRGQKGIVVTDAGHEYLAACKEALQSIRAGRDLLDKHQLKPGGLLRISCPMTLAVEVFSSVLVDFIQKYPDLRIQVDPYIDGAEREPREDTDILFTTSAPLDSYRRMRRFPSIKRGLFASASYIQAHGSPSRPEDLAEHRCIGSDVWMLQQDGQSMRPEIRFHVLSSDPTVNLELVSNGVGIAILPLCKAFSPDNQRNLVPILPAWRPENGSLKALYYGSAQMTPKVRVFLDFLGDYFGTEQEARLQGKDRGELFFPARHRADSDLLNHVRAKFDPDTVNP